MLELKELYKTFNPGTINAKTALNGLSLTLNDGDFVTVIGGNGAGKSTMLNATAGTFFVDSGKVIIDGSDVTNLPEHKRAAFIGRVFQDPMMGTAPSMWIEENLALAARRGQRRGLSWGVTKEEKEQYRELLGGLGLGLESRLTTKVSTLSGGQRQALTLLMATLKRPKLLLLDEHTAALDPKTAAKVMELLGYDTEPRSDAVRHDIIQMIHMREPEALKKFCRGIQFGAPVDSYVTPEPWDMPGYDCPVIMAAGAFIQGASIELSADAPMRPPYTVYLQGGLTFESGRLVVLLAVQELLGRS